MKVREKSTKRDYEGGQNLGRPNDCVRRRGGNFYHPMGKGVGGNIVGQFCSRPHKCHTSWWLLLLR